ncbi:MAG: ABC transporter substrate-binding protein [Candidatus Bathyarchaeia archaeon]
MAKRNLWIIIGVVVVIAGIIVGIRLTQKPAPKEQVIKIGAILPLTGPASFAGEVAKMGLDIAAEDIASKGIKVRIIYQDGQGDPKKSLDAFRHLVNVEGVRIVVTYISQVGLALKQQAESQKIILFSNVTHPGMTKSTNFIFRMSPTVETELKKFIEYLNQGLRGQRGPILVYYQTDEYGNSFASLLKATPEYSTYSFKFISYDPKQTDFRPVVAKGISGQQPELVAIVGFGQSLGLLIKQIREYGYKGNIYASLGFILTDAYKIAGDAAVGVYHPDLEIKTDDPNYQALISRFRKKFGKEMLASSWIFYNTLLLIADVLNNKVGMSPSEISTSIRKMKVFHGVGGTFEIQESGDIIPPLKLTQWRRSK